MRAIPPALVALALTADAAGLGGLASLLLLAAVPAAAAAALSFFGELVDAAARSSAELLGRVQTTLSALALVLLVLATAVRAPARVGADVPAIGTSALVGCAVLYGAQVLVALGLHVPRQRVASTPRRYTRVA